MRVEDLVLVSIDDHVVEPRDMFERHVPERWRDHAPRSVIVFFFEGEGVGESALTSVQIEEQASNEQIHQLLHELQDMKLIREPRPFSLHTSRHIMRMIGHSDQKWRKYLYY